MSAAFLLTLLLVSRSSGLDLGSFLGLPQLSATSEAPPIPETVEIVRWRQPVCVVPAEGVPPCFLGLRKFQNEYELLSGHSKKTLNSAEVRNSIGIDELEASSLPTEEIRDRLEETPALRRRRDFTGRILFEGKKHAEVVAKPPPIYVTKVLNSPVTATLVAQNCFPDIGVPLCEGYQSYEVAYASGDSPTRIPLQLPAEQSKPTVLQAIHDMFAHKPQVVKELAGNFTAAAKEKIQDKHEAFQHMLEKKQQQQLVEALAERKEAAVQGLVDKRKQVLGAISSAKQDAVQAVVEKKQGVMASIADSLGQKKDSVVQAIAEKQAAIKGIVEKTQSVVQELIDRKLALEMDIANRGQSLVQDIADKKQNLIQGIADTKQSVIQRLADKKTDAVKAISERTQEIIGTVSVMKPLFISSIQQNLGLGPKESSTDEELDRETTTQEDDIVFEEIDGEAETLLLDERSAGNDSDILAETTDAPVTTTESFYRVIGAEDVSGRSATLDEPEVRSLERLRNMLGKPFAIFKKTENANATSSDAAHKPSLLSSLLSGVFNHRKPTSNDNSSSSITQASAAPIVTGSGDPVVASEPEVTTALSDVAEEPSNSTSARPAIQSLSLPAFTEENEEESNDQLQVLDNPFTPISKDPPAEVSFDPTIEDEPIVIVHETTASPETKTIVPIDDSNGRPVVLVGNAMPHVNKDSFVLVGDLVFVGEKANRIEEGVAEDDEDEKLQSV